MIVDTQFESATMRARVLRSVKIIFDSLAAEDSFGLISLKSMNSQSMSEDIKLEQKRYNSKVKSKFLDFLKEKELDFNFVNN